MLITFGPGTDMDTFETVFGRLIGYQVTFQAEDGVLRDAEFAGVCVHEGMISFAFKLESGDVFKFPVDRVVEFVIH